VAEADRIAAEYARRASSIPAERYSPATPAQVLLRQSRERAVLVALRRAGMLPLAGRRILDVGCGAGQWLADFETWGADRARLAGIDLLPERVAFARARLTPGADLREGDASRLPWPSGGFDIVLQSTVFSSILDAAMRTAVAGEMARVLAPGGVIVWNDFFVDNPRNRAVRGVRGHEVAALFPGFSVEMRRVTLAAPLARAIAPRSQIAAIALEALRVFDTHYLGVLKRPG
jgi:ubiquinone/menaquinone biosynthesis C-methylase UbiE